MQCFIKTDHSNVYQGTINWIIIHKNSTITAWGDKLKEKIERFSKGNFDYEQPFLCLSIEEINITVEAGKVYEGNFVISNHIGSRIKGIVYSSNRLLTLGNSSFSEETNTIYYQFNASYLKAGEQISGELSVISDCGEVLIPFVVMVEQSHCLSSLGKIKDLFQFTNLARMDWSDAKKVFRSEDFERIFLANEERYRIIYRNLIKSISTSQALEEFLIAIHKKAAIRLNIDKTLVEYADIQEPIMDKLTITKNNWGYAEIRVSADAPFILLEQKFLWADRFIGNTHHVTYTIDPKNLKHGNNFGHIWIKSAYQTIEVNIVCKCKGEGIKTSENRHIQRMEYELVDHYLSFRLNRNGFKEYLEASEGIMHRLPGPEVSNWKELIRTHLAIISGKNKLAEELLEDFSKETALLRKKSVLEYCTYLYLNALYRKEDKVVQNAAETIRQFYVSSDNDWKILWFLLYLDKRYEKNKAAMLADIKEQFDSGCRSPILYYEAVCIYNDEPVLLRDLENFEIQVLNFGIKNWMLSKETAKQYAYIAGKMKTFHPIVFRGLTRLYDEYDTAEYLSAICSLLIKGMKKSEKYFNWYRLGVEAQLRITELYEYYMYSISVKSQGVLAQQVLHYFVYNSNLNDQRKAFLFANIVKNQDKYEQIYRSYYKRMEVFTQKMLEAHYISADLAVLYQEFLNKPEMRVQLLPHLPYVLYRHEFVCDNPNMVNVVVLHKELGIEENVPLSEGKALIDIYTDHSVIMLVDSFGNRYVESVEYTVSPFLRAEDYETLCIGHSKHPMLLLHLYDHYQSHRIMNENSVMIRKLVLQVEQLSKEYITKCYQSLIEYYYESIDDESLDFYLSQIDLYTVHPTERVKFLEFLVIRALYEKALEALEIFGFEDISINRLVKLCSGWIQTPALGKRHDFMITLCYYVYSQGKYDEAILRYLIKYYSGTTIEMFGIWKAAKGFELDSHILEERLLSYLLFTETGIERSYQVFQSYYKEITNHVLVRAYLTFCAYHYLVHNLELNAELIMAMKRELFYEENDICLMAWLKYNAKNQMLSESELIFAEFNLHRFITRRIILPFFLEYRNRIELPESILDQYFITHNTDPGKRVYINYRLLNRSGQEYITQRMPNVFMGIHIKEFILFYHEELQYFITEETDDEIVTGEINHLRYPCENFEEDESNYNQINSMLMAMEKQEEDLLLDKMESYVKKEYMISECFKQI